MINHDVSSYFKANFASDLRKISEMSASGQGKVLVCDDRVLYDFDEITKKIYCYKNLPSSADSIFISNRKVIFIEYKSGFEQRITKKTFDINKLECPSDSTKLCMDYGKILKKRLDLEKKELLDSIRFKAIESYITLDKKILPSCGTMKIKSQIIYCVVIDAYNDSEEDTLAELAKKPTSNNLIADVKSSLKRFVNHFDVQGNAYYYDEINVFTPHEFITYLNRLIKN